MRTTIKSYENHKMSSYNNYANYASYLPTTYFVTLLLISFKNIL